MADSNPYFPDEEIIGMMRVLLKENTPMMFQIHFELRGDDFQASARPAPWRGEQYDRSQVELAVADLDSVVRHHRNLKSNINLYAEALSVTHADGTLGIYAVDRYSRIHLLELGTDDQERQAHFDMPPPALVLDENAGDLGDFRLFGGGKK